MKSSRRNFLKKVGLSTVALSCTGFLSRCVQTSKQPNILLITADDLNWDSLGCFGCTVDDITPNLDKLASEGLRFENAHVNVAVCQPCRGTIMTGRYPVRSGVEGFHHIDNRNDVITLTESLIDGNYFVGMMGKIDHSSPKQFHIPRIGKDSKYKYDWVKYGNELGMGRDPNKYYASAMDFFQQNKKTDKPFFLMANSHDPHRPFADSKQEKAFLQNGREIYLNRKYNPDEVNVPGFLPDLHEVRLEMSEYYSSVHRCDETVGMLLKALDESEFSDNTLVIFLSDHGMATPFAKVNCYLNSTKTPCIIRWPNKIKNSIVDQEHFIASIDIMPTILAATGIKIPKKIDGKSFLPLLFGNKQSNRDYVFSEFNESSSMKRYPMRCVQDKKYGYIYNFWSNGEREQVTESQTGRTWKAMVKAAEHNPGIKARVELYRYRVPEELYDLQKDPNCLKNLINDPKYKSEIEKYCNLMENHLQETEDLALTAFQNRNKRELSEKYMEEVSQQVEIVPPVEIKHKATAGMISIKNKYSEKYTAGGENGLIDGLKAADDIGTKSDFSYWQGFEKNDLEAIVDLQSLQKISHISTGFMQKQTYWIFFPEYVEYSVSVDGKVFRQIEKIKCPISPKNSDLLTHSFTADFQKTEARFVKVKAKNVGKTPSWLFYSFNGDAWLFADEIIVK